MSHQMHKSWLSGEAVRRIDAEDQNVIHILTGLFQTEGASTERPKGMTSTAC